MTAFLTTIMWRDIPAQVVAKDGRRAHKIVLHPRFQVAIDKAAVKADKKAFNDYVEEWRKVMRECGDDLLAEAEAEAERLEQAYTRHVLADLVASGGIAKPAAADGAPEQAAGKT
jgi:hypothetical protein